MSGGGQCYVDPIYALLKFLSYLLLSVLFRFLATSLQQPSRPKNCWVGVGVILAITSVLATLGGCRLSAITGF